MNSKFLLVSLVLLAILTQHRCEEGGQEYSLADDQGEVPYSTATAKEFYDLVSEGNKDGYFVFFGAGWCGHCRNFKPTFKELATKSQSKQLPINPTFILYQVEGSDPITTFFKIRAYPTMIYIKDGNYCDFEGMRNEENLVKFFKEGVDGDKCKPYLSSYPGLIDAVINKGEEIYNQIQHEMAFYFVEYPTLVKVGAVIFAFAMVVNILGLVACLKYLFCKRKEVAKVPVRVSRVNESTPARPSTDSDQFTRVSKKDESDRTSAQVDKRESSKNQDTTEELQNVRKRVQRD